MKNYVQSILQGPRLLVAICITATTIILGILASPLVIVVAVALAALVLVLKDFRIGTLLVVIFGFTVLAAQEALKPFHMLLLLTILTLFSFLLALLTRRVKFESPREFNVLLVVFGSWAFLSGILAIDHKLWIGSVETMVRAYIVFYLIYNSISKKEDLLLAFKVIVLSIFLSSAISFFASFGISAFSVETLLTVFSQRFAGTIFDPNYFAMAIAASLPLAIVIILRERTWLIRIMWIVMVLFLLFSIIISQSRTGIFSTSVIFVYTMYYLGKKRRKEIFVFIIPIAAVIILLPGIFWHRFAMFWQSITAGVRADISMMHRIELLNSAFDVFTRNPILGVGLNNFWAIAARYTHYPMVCHNTYLEIASNLGVIGLIPFVLILYKGFSLPGKVMHDSELSDLAWAIRAGLLGCYVAILFISVPFILNLWILLALSAVIFKISSQKHAK